MDVDYFVIVYPEANDVVVDDTLSIDPDTISVGECGFYNATINAYTCGVSGWYFWAYVETDPPGSASSESFNYTIDFFSGLASIKEVTSSSSDNKISRSPNIKGMEKRSVHSPDDPPMPLSTSRPTDSPSLSPSTGLTPSPTAGPTLSPTQQPQINMDCVDSQNGTECSEIPFCNKTLDPSLDCTVDLNVTVTVCNNWTEDMSIGAFCLKKEWAHFKKKDCANSGIVPSNIAPGKCGNYNTTQRFEINVGSPFWIIQALVETNPPEGDLDYLNYTYEVRYTSSSANRKKYAWN